MTRAGAKEGTVGAGLTNEGEAARLLREWQGVMHEVIVLESSVRYRGKLWLSLSAVAREITGARWSGPKFFGLRPRGNGR